MKIINYTETEDEIVHELPSKYEVCPRCHGKGSHVNPNVDGHGLTWEDFDQDPDFKEAYFSGVYDVACYECKGKRVIEVPDESLFNDEDRAAYEQHLENLRDVAEMEATYQSERRMGA